MKITAIALLAVLTATSAFAQSEVQSRPQGLKAQVDVMKQEVPERFKCMVAEINEDYSNDKSTALFVLKGHVKAYWDLREGTFPTDIIAEAFNDYPCDFSTAVFVIKKNTKASSELDSLLK